MIRRTLITCAAAAAVLAGCGDNDVTRPVAPADTISVVFQDGFSPASSYYGTRDAILKDGPNPQLLNGNFGHLPVDTLGVVWLAGGLWERRLLVRFDLSSITDCSAVISARLRLSLEALDTSLAVTLAAYEATVPPAVPGSWHEGSGGVAGGVSWQTVDGSYPWNTAGGDVLGFLDLRLVGADSTVVFELPPERVNLWLNAPALNHGVLVVPGGHLSERYLLAYMRETPDIRRRPQLSIVYARGGG